MRVAANCELDVFGNFYLHHCGLVINDLLDGDDDLVDIFLVDLFTGLEPLDHVIDEFLGHLVLELYTVVVWLDSNGINIEAFSGRRLITDFDGSIEI